MTAQIKKLKYYKVTGNGKKFFKKKKKKKKLLWTTKEIIIFVPARASKRLLLTLLTRGKRPSAHKNQEKRVCEIFSFFLLNRRPPEQQLT